MGEGTERVARLGFVASSILMMAATVGTPILQAVRTQALLSGEPFESVMALSRVSGILGAFGSFGLIFALLCVGVVWFDRSRRGFTVSVPPSRASLILVVVGAALGIGGGVAYVVPWLLEGSAFGMWAFLVLATVHGVGLSLVVLGLGVMAFFPWPRGARLPAA